MLFLDKEDYFEVYLGSMLSSYDRDTITALYQPIIGFSASSLFFTLWSLHKQQDVVDVFSHKYLLDCMDISITDLQEARKKLEGIGLLQSFYKKEGNAVFYQYILFAPKSPKEFFDDILFKGLLVEKIGPKQTQRLASLYKSRTLDTNGYVEISDSFRNVYSPNLDSSSFRNETSIEDNTYKRLTKDISQGFDVSKFLKSLETTYLIDRKNVSKEMIKAITGLSLLYGISEEDFADLFSQAYLPDQMEKLDLNKLRKLCDKEKSINVLREYSSGNDAYDFTSKLGKKINTMAITAPFDYLKLKQGFTMPAPSDVSIVQSLFDMGITPGVINAIIDYSLEKCNNILNKNYCTKLGASLLREKITNVMDAMNYLYKNQNYKKKKNDLPEEEKIVEKENEEETNKVSDEEAEDFFKSLE